MTSFVLLVAHAGSALLPMAIGGRSSVLTLVARRRPLRLAQAICQAEDVDVDVNKLVNEASGKMKKSVGNVQEQLATLRVGRASTDMLDRVQVDYYGMPTPLNQLASVSTPTSQQLLVDVYDKSCLGDVERALMESDLGMTPSNDGSVIRLNVPMLTAERRKELAKTAKSLGEDGKVALRNIRRDAIDKIKKAQKSGLSEDESKQNQNTVDKEVKKMEKEIATLVEKREAEILKI
eukprot:CAMPEP_0119308782 /NCGR_PEP_ID=MMETSP1333-20130426/12762_1 /TAXON_ID=418940 /ORGANISM="Scyphosphaera apsteinii, Strain RCC1455" /LENGTH=234 /DNA_ID=CAMNT_0007312627 /DNA_START=12 /DNA_END=716 /DNA_ORIENTATION=-